MILAILSRVFWVLMMAVYLFLSGKERSITDIDKKLTLHWVQIVLSLSICIAEFFMGEIGLGIVWIIPFLISLMDYLSTRKTYDFFHAKNPPKDMNIREVWADSLLKDLNKAFLKCQTQGEVYLLQSMLHIFEILTENSQKSPDTQDKNKKE